MSAERPPPLPVDRPLVATYRLQLHEGFRFAHAMQRLPYLQQLGVSHLYLSPVLQAARGSKHGYDLVDPTRISEELGGREGFEQLVSSAHARGIGIVLDVVPNHMSISDPRNRWWWDVLEYGPSGRWAHAFDIDWDAPEPGLGGVVLLPVLSDHRHRVLERGEVKVQREGGAFLVRYKDLRFPLAPKSIGPLLREAACRCNNQRVLFFADAYEQLEHHGVIADLLDELLEKSPMCAAALDAGLEALNRDPRRLEQLLETQCYRLSYWRRADHDLDYRRFFDVSSLVALRADDPRVFDASHALLRELVKGHFVDGLRVDHIDGLAKPRAYLERLRDFQTRVWVEKILAPDEELRSWPVAGTTGYEFSADACALFVPPEAEAPLSTLQRELAREPRSFWDIAAEARTQAIDEMLASDVSRLTTTLLELRQHHADLADFSSHELEALVRALASAFPVYRTYVEPGQEPSETDGRLIELALAEARGRHPDLDAALLDFAGDLLLGKRRGPLEARFVERLQQLCAPAMAKGTEDTALYRDVRLLALNDVGSSPARFSLSASGFHARQLHAQERWPERLLALSTHDTKRSADVRARLVAMSWQATAFASLARDFFGMVPSKEVDGRMKLYALQTLVGAWPMEVERFEAVLLKSAREAKLQTRWTRPDEEYEKALSAWAKAVLESTAVRSMLALYVAGLEVSARGISAGWTLLQCTCPGVPDVYQGCELWRHLLVDPDNRREVEWEAAERAVNEKLPALDADETGVTKLHVLRRALSLRRRYPELFRSYEPLKLTGVHAGDAVAFSRGGGVVVVVAIRPVAHWGDTCVELPPGSFESLLISDGRYSGAVRLAALFEALPLALLKVV